VRDVCDGSAIPSGSAIPDGQPWRDVSHVTPFVPRTGRPLLSALVERRLVLIPSSREDSFCCL